MVVHGEEAVLQTLKEKLSMSGCIARPFTSGLDGMLQGRIEKFDWVVSGIDLPAVSGLEMVRSLRLNPMNKDTNVMFLGDGKETAACRYHILRLGAHFLRTDEFGNIKWNEIMGFCN